MLWFFALIITYILEDLYILTFRKSAKKVHIFHVRWQTAKRSTMQELRTARKVKNQQEDPHNGTLNLAIKKYVDATKEGEFTEEDKMDIAIECLKEAAAERGIIYKDADSNQKAEKTPAATGFVRRYSCRRL